MLFNYHPLQPDSLRLLKPVAITHDFLAFEISHHPRTAAPSYTAVSYTWGDGAPTEQIVLNGQSFNVRLNLWSCLYYLGGAVKFGRTPCTYLWVDAICIDQNNAEERNAQVRFMDQTYRNAIVVSVWLGLPPIPEFLEAQLVNYCKPIKTYEEEGFDWSDSIEDLANRPYWSRFWVVQEFLLGQDVHLYCGDSRMNWSDFRRILGTETDVQDYFEEDVHYAHSSSGSWTAWPLVTGRHPDKHPEMQQSLYRLLITYETSQCKNPRDRVFALLGLVTAEERALLERFLPNYNMAEDDVVLIALCHVRLNVNIHDRGPVEVERLLLALGVYSEVRQRRLIRRTNEFDYLGDQPPSAYEVWFCDQETSEFDISNWGSVSGPEIGGFGSEVHNTRREGRARRRGKRSLCTLGLLTFIVVVVKLYRPQIWQVFVSYIIQNIARARKFRKLVQR